MMGSQQSPEVRKTVDLGGDKTYVSYNEELEGGAGTQPVTIVTRAPHLRMPNPYPRPSEAGFQKSQASVGGMLSAFERQSCVPSCLVGNYWPMSRHQDSRRPQRIVSILHVSLAFHAL